MKTAPKYIKFNPTAFLEAKELIRQGKYWQASQVVKDTGNKKLVQRIQQKIDSEVRKSISRTGKTRAS